MDSKALFEAVSSTTTIREKRGWWIFRTRNLLDISPLPIGVVFLQRIEHSSAVVILLNRLKYLLTLHRRESRNGMK